MLARIAHACRDALRHIDLFGRHGGEEFLVLLPDTRLAYAWPVAERLRTAVAGLSFDDIAPGLAVTVSIGMSVPLWWNHDGIPIGVHFLGRYGDEATLFRLAGQLEAVRPWATRRPPVSA